MKADSRSFSVHHSFLHRCSRGVFALCWLILGGAAAAAFSDANWGNVGGPPGADGVVNATVVDAHGNLYIGGFFANVNGVSANCIAKWDGTNWSALGSGMAGGTSGLNTFVNALAFDTNGILYASGNFTAAGGTGANYIAKWNGTNWSSVGSGLNYVTYALAADRSGNIYAGGGFTQAGGNTARFIARWDGASWSALGTGMQNTVFGLACDNSTNVYACGTFSTAGGVTANSVAKWNGSAWSAMASGLNFSGFTATLFALALDGSGNVYCGGAFDSAGSGIARWNGTNWSSVGGGVDTEVYVLTFDGSGNLYAGGRFNVAGGVGANYIAKWNGSAWSALGSGLGPVNPFDRVYGLAADSSGNLYVGGRFTTAGTNNNAAYIAKALLDAAATPASYILSLARSSAGTNLITVQATSGYNYALELTTNLSGPANWLPQTTNPATGPPLVFTNVNLTPQGYYRIRAVP